MQAKAVEVLLMIDQLDALEVRRSHRRDRAEDFMLNFRGLVAANSVSPFDTLRKLLQPPEESSADSFDENALPAPSAEQRVEDERWLRERLSGGSSMSAAELEGWV